MMGTMIASTSYRCSAPFTSSTPTRSYRQRSLTTVCNSSKKQEDVGVGLKAVWFGAEAFGNVVGALKNNQVTTIPISSEVLSREEAIAALREDYDSNYFISGLGDLKAYEPDCEFADVFVSFKGTERFRKNVANLGGMLQDVQLDITEWTENSDSLRTKWRFSAILTLPWRPKLAAAGATTHVFDANTGRVKAHIEEWDIEPSVVIKQLLKPSSKIPTSQWDVLMASLGAGDVMGVWLALSSLFLKGSGAVLMISLPLKIFTGEGLPGSGVAAFVFVACIVTEVLKFSGGLQGGETGTGGRF